MKDREGKNLRLTEEQIKELFEAREILNKFFEGRGRGEVFSYVRGTYRSCTFTCSGSCSNCQGSCGGTCKGNCEGGCKGKCEGGCGSTFGSTAKSPA